MDVSSIEISDLFKFLGLVFASTLLLVLITNTRLELYLQRYGDENDFISIKVIVLKFLKYKKDIKMVDMSEKNNQLSIRLQTADNKATNKNQSDKNGIEFSLRNIKIILDKIYLLIINRTGFIGNAKQVLSGFSLLELNWLSNIGLNNDAANVGRFIGCGWILKSSVMYLLLYFFPIAKKPYINISPEYHQDIFKTQISCIFQFKVGYAIYAAIKLFYLYKKGVQHV